MKVIIALLAAISSTALHASLRYIDYDDVRKEGGFGSPSLANVCSIVASDNKLTDTEKQALLESTHLHHIHTLDLSGQDIDDSFVEKLVRNGALKRIMTLDLSNNPKITNLALDYILKSSVLGSIRDLPQTSARYGGPSTTIRVKRRNTGITTTNIEPVYYFSINYINPITGSSVYETTDQGIKLLAME